MTKDSFFRLALTVLFVAVSVITLSEVAHCQDTKDAVERNVWVQTKTNTASGTIVKADTKNLSPVKLGKADVADPVFYVGNTNGHLNFVSFGRVNFINQYYLYTDTVGVEGCSGGGLYNFKGELVGLNVGHEKHAIAFHIRRELLEKFLKGGSP